MAISLVEKIVNHCPKHEFNGGKGEKLINFFDKHVSVTENRLLIGVSALVSQPFIDLYNKDVDEKTRIVSCARTIAKTGVGTLTGVAIRVGFIKLAQKYSAVGGKNVPKIKKIFTPSIAKSDKTHAYRQYQSTMGTLLAVAALVFTNFLLDAPLTVVTTNLLLKKMDIADDTEKKEALDGKSK